MLVFSPLCIYCAGSKNVKKVVLKMAVLERSALPPPPIQTQAETQGGTRGNTGRLSSAPLVQDLEQHLSTPPPKMPLLLHTSTAAPPPLDPA